MLTYKVHHIWYLLRWPTSQKYFRTCQVCNNSFDSTAPVAVSAGIDDGVKTRHPIQIFRSLGLGGRTGRAKRVRWHGHDNCQY